MRTIRISKADALIAVDVQPTFMPGGGLPVAGGDEVVPAIRRLMERFAPVMRMATRDLHPPGHISLASSYEGLAPYAELTRMMDVQSVSPASHAKFTRADLDRYLIAVGSQVLWPDHAIEGTAESELHPALPEEAFAFVQVKGTDPLCDSYSGFYDNLGRPTGFADVLRASGAERLFISGLAYDFCVGWTAFDAVKAGWKEVFVVRDATRPVGLPGTVEKTEAGFVAAGVRVVESWQLASA